MLNRDNRALSDEAGFRILFSSAAIRGHELAPGEQWEYRHTQCSRTTRRLSGTPRFIVDFAAYRLESSKVYYGSW